MIFPDWSGGARETAAVRSLPIYTEYDVDWEAGTLCLEADGRPRTLFGAAALRIWIRLALHPQNTRFACTAHSHDYGNELSALLGEGGDRGILESRVRQYICEALLVSPYIRAVEGFAFSWAGARLRVSFGVSSVYGKFSEFAEVTVG